MVDPLGHKLSSSAKVEQLIDQLVNEAVSLSASITGPKEPSSSMAGPSAELVEKAGQLRGRPLFYPYIGTGIGRGPYVELEDGSVKLDLINGIGIHVLGHSHPGVLKAGLRGSLSDIVMQGNLQPNREWLNLTETLVNLASKNSRLKHAWITTSGSMANENALKMCRQKASPARKIIAMEAAFAGRTTMMAEITDNPAFKQGLPDYNEVLRVPFFDRNDPKSTEKSLQVFKKHVSENPGDICAFMFEIMQGEGGYRSAPREYFLPMLEICKQEKIPVWVDEVQTFCRTGEFFAYETLDLGSYVDVCTVAKTAQVGATLFTEEFNPQPGLIAGTYSSSTQSLAVGCEVLRLLEEENYMGANGKIAKIHEEFVAMLNRLNETTCKGLLQDAGGMGLMIAVTPLDGSKEKMMELLKTLYKNGLMTFGCGRGPFRLRFLVPAVMTSEDIQVAGKILEKSVLELA